MSLCLIARILPAQWNLSILRYFCDTGFILHAEVGMSQESGAVKPQLEAEWLERLQAAHINHRKALDHQQRMMDDLDQALMKDVDGSFTLVQSKHAAKVALDDLVRCQEVLVNLILRENMPPDEEL
jgi:hypothetical protein